MKKTKYIGWLIVYTMIAALISTMLFSCSDDEKEIEYIEIPTPITILRSDSADPELTSATVKLRGAIEEATGIRPELVTDWVKRGEEIPAINGEIIVGETNREASKVASDELKAARPNSANDWSLTEYNGALLISGGSSAAINDAVEYCVENYIIDGVVKIPRGLEYVYLYPYPEMNIGNDSIFDYSIPANDFIQLDSTNEYLRNKISKAIDWSVPKENKKAINISIDNSIDADTYSISVTDMGASISGGSFDAARAGADKFYDLLINDQITENYNYKEKFVMTKFDTKAPAITKPCTPIGNPIYLIDDQGRSNSGWNIDYSGASVDMAVQSANKLSALYIDDISKTDKCSMSRKFNVQSSGVMTLEMNLSISEINGFEIAVKDSETELSAVKLVANDGKLIVGDKEIRTMSGTSLMRITIDLDRSKYSMILNNVDCGEFDFNEKVAKLDTLVIESTDEAVVKVTPGIVLLYKNVAIEERFSLNKNGESPIGFNILSGKSTVSDGTLVLEAGEEAAIAERPFKAFDGLAIFELKLFASDYNGGAEVALMSGDKTAAAFKLDGSNICYNDTVLRSYTTDFWYTLRLEADTRTGKVQVKINGKSLGYTDLIENVTSFDRIKLTSASGRIAIDDIKTYQYIRPDDYVPAPLSSGSENGGVGLQVCSLWRNGGHWGWDVISPYDDLKPLIGMYDEGNVETADWEIKYMAEHGVDFQLYCWYAGSSSPMKCGAADHLHTAYFNAEYSDQMKFAIMWENANGAKPANPEAFRKYFVPYWVEYYLTDPRYMVIDNKPVITVFSEAQLIKDFGSAAAVKKEFDYLREVCRGLGFDDAIILCQSTTQSADQLRVTDSFGADAIYAYNWTKSYKSEIYENNILTQAKYTKVVPTISVGFNNIAWAGTPSPMIDHDDYKSALEWVRDEYHPQYEGSIQSKLTILSTWNEYGEGTYIIPSGGHGFAYMDAVREVFAPNNEYENIVPTDAQKARICQLYVQDRSILRPDYSDDAKFSPESDIYEAKYSIDFANGAAGFSVGFGVDNFKAENGVIKGSSNKLDFAVMSPNNLTLNGEAVDITGVKYVKVRMKCSVDGTAEIFFITGTDANYDQGKSASAMVNKSDEMVDYYFDLSANSAFTGTLKQLRIDPLNFGCEFEIESIEFLSEKNAFSIKTRDTEVAITKYSPMYVDDILMLPIDASSAIDQLIGCAYEWKKNECQLTLIHRGNKLVLTVGSDTAYLNGQEQKLSHTVDSFDGLPIIPFSDVKELLKLDCELIQTK
ncbi:MAG: hypothetical protein HFE63_08040 [Clostridiales bacterium]|nr:hypothetical protein [Clostridiales bacterium]